MDRQALITRFEAELGRVNRPGIDKLMGYIRGSDFYTAPASTKFHLSCEGGLLQHSLNVLDALRGLLAFNTITGFYEYHAAEKVVAEIPAESVTIAAMLHDICKTYFYGTSTRNQKNDATGKWEKVPYYTVEDKMPLGHGPKSAMIVKQYMELTTPEMYAIWWHMGFNGNYENDTAAGASFEKYPLALAIYTADMMASRLMEGEKENKQLFLPADPAPAGAAQEATPPAQEDAPPPAAEWQDAPPLQAGASPAMTYPDYFLLGIAAGIIGCEIWSFISEIALPHFQRWRARRWIRKAMRGYYREHRRMKRHRKKHGRETAGKDFRP